MLNHAENFEAVLADMGEAGQSYVKGMKLDESKVSVRFLRVIKALRVACQGKSLICDISVGKAIDAFIGSPFAHFISAK